MLKLYPDPGETIEGVGAALRAGRTTCVKVLDHCFHQIDLWDAKVNAWVVIDRAGAMRQARTLDEELSVGKCRGPLHGIPFGIKDIIDVQGLPTAAGFSPWRERVAEQDAHVVERLRDDGAVILGKTATTQFAWIDPPPTRNPWNLERTPGGSSSGSAAAVATGMCPGAIGTQTGGSIIRPASFCGVCGYKPGYGRVDSRGVLPFAPSLDHPGPIARCVSDLRTIFVAIDRARSLRDWATPDDVRVQRDPTTARPEWNRPPILTRLRGVYDARSEPAMFGAFERALNWFRAAGAVVHDRADPFEGVHQSHRVIMASEAASGHEARFGQSPGEYQPRIRSLIEEGGTIPATEYIRCREHQLRLSRELPDLLFGPFRVPGEAIVVPAAPGPAPDTSTTGDPVFNSPWSYVGAPAVSVPIGLSPDGMPMALQLVGPWRAFRAEAGADDDLFLVALWCEEVLRTANRPQEG